MLDGVYKIITEAPDDFILHQIEAPPTLFLLLGGPILTLGQSEMEPCWNRVVVLVRLGLALICPSFSGMSLPFSWELVDFLLLSPERPREIHLCHWEDFNLALQLPALHSFKILKLSWGGNQQCIWGRSLPSWNILFPKYYEIMGDFIPPFGLAMYSPAQPQNSVNAQRRKLRISLGHLHFQSVISVPYYQQKPGWFLWAPVQSHCLGQAQLSALTQNH